jgi:hypothetical protein
LDVAATDNHDASIPGNSFLERALKRGTEHRQLSNQLGEDERFTPGKKRQLFYRGFRLWR